MTPEGFYMLRDWKASLNAPGPTDFGLLFRYVTLDANGEAVVDLSDVMQPGTAPFHYFIFSKTGVFPNIAAATFGTASITINPGGVGIGLAAAAAPTGGTANAVPVASGTFLVAFLVHQSELKQV